MEPMTGGAVMATTAVATGTGLIVAKTAAIAVCVGLLGYGAYKLYRQYR